MMRSVALASGIPTNTFLFCATGAVLLGGCYANDDPVATNDFGRLGVSALAFKGGAPPSPPPQLGGLPATSLTTNGLSVNGRIQPHGLATTYHFEYGETADYGGRTAERSLP